MMTLKNISRLSGFSTSTVSKALNNCYDVSADTKKIIQELAIQNNYVPNKNAIALRKSKTHIIAVILPQVNLKIYGDLLYAIHKRAEESGYRILLYQSFKMNSKELEFLEDISDGSVDGAFIVSTNEEMNSKRSIPLEYFQIDKRRPEQDLLDRCQISFGNLLKLIK